MKKTVQGIFFLLLAGLTAAAADLPVKAVLFPFRESVISARIDSVLQPCRVRIGEKFAAGTVLATLDDARSTNEVNRATGQYEFAKASYEDKKALRAKNFTSDYELKKAEFDYRTAQTALEDAKLNLSFCTIRAPFAGKVVEILTREYETTRPGQPLFRIIDDNTLLAVLNVPLNSPYTRTGTPVTLKLDNGATAAGKVYEVTPQADHRTGTVRIRVLIDNAEGRFFAGMTGELIHGK